jgi:very-short-patch-repair endonuclease
MQLAAVMACGASAVLSHLSAAMLWGLLPYPAHVRLQHVTVIGRNPGTKPGIRIHRVSVCDPRELRVHQRIPVTSPARALLDSCAQIDTRQLENASAEAFARRLVTHAELERTLDRNRRRPGAARFRALLEGHRDPALTRSEAEWRMLALLRKAKLTPPVVNARIGEFEVDFLWRAERLIVEVDGFQFHSSRLAFERDRARDAELGSRGFRVIRVTWRQLVDRPEAVMRRIRRALRVV